MLTIVTGLISFQNGFVISTWQRGRLEDQIRQHEKKRAAAISANGDKKEMEDDDLYEVTLDDDFLTALEYGMPPASGMVSSSVLRALLI